METKTSKKTILIGQMKGKFKNSNRVYDTKACCPTITTCGGGDRQPKVIKKWSEKMQKLVQ